MAAQEKPKVIPVDLFVRDELYPGYTQAFGARPFVAGPVRPFSKADNASYWLRDSLHFSAGMVPASTAPRKLGAVGWDVLPVYEVQRPLNDTESIWDYASEYRFPRARTDRRPKIRLPGPYGVTTELDFSPVYRNRRDCGEALVPAIRRDIQDPVAAGCDYIQIEEPLTPSRAAEDRTAENLVDLVNKVVNGVSGCTFVVRICFGSFRRLPYAKRTYRWFSPALLDANVHGFSVEFDAREIAEIDLVGKWDRERVLSAGLIDIKTHYCETLEDIIERVRTCLEYRDLERLEISTDYGLRRVPRYLTISKMSAAAEAARRLRASG